ncbi:MAG: pyridoxal phosphate-dependent aminotransferase [Thiotrichales bacterium]|jgi:aspartate aminotransferase|nr:pyridoxal phosphate-dependent aminotransferase [Thiotrichales bacterium]
MQLAQRVLAVKESPTLVVTARALELKRQGRDIISLGAGEPDFPTPAHIRQAGIDAIQAGKTRYTAVDGTPDLKEAIIAKFQRENKLNYTANQILVSSGGKQSFYNLCQAYLNDGDEVIIPAPYWVSYPDMVLLAGGQPVIVQAGIEQGFKITPEQLTAAITPATKLFVINSPSNPTGAVYSQAELRALGDVLAKHPHILIATDDMYEHIILGDTPFSTWLNACPEMVERTVTLNGVSKAYSMTGWRIGYCAGPAELINEMKKVQSQSTSNPCSISQAATVVALNGDQSFIGDMVTAFKARSAYVTKTLNSMPGIKALSPDGAFYNFFDVRGAMAATGCITDTALATRILEESDLALVPGSAFGSEGYMRLSFATSMAELEGAMSRLAAFLAKNAQ